LQQQAAAAMRVALLALLALCSSVTLAVGQAAEGAAVAQQASVDDKILKCRPNSFRVVDEVMNESHDWLDWDTFNTTYMVNPSLYNRPVITAEVSEVPCAAKGCCNMLMNFRPNTTDFKVFQQVFQWGFFSPIYEQLQKIKPKFILDGGGNVGYASSLFAMVYPDAHIITVEPDKSNFATLKMNTHRFPNVHAVNAGLWDKQTHISLMAQEGEWGYMFQEVPSAREGSVYGTTITNLLRRFNFPRLDFAKIDIEGAESRVLSANADLAWLDSTKLICMELHDWMAHYYGLEKVSDIVMGTMEAKPFTSFWDGEHVFYQHKNLDAAHTRHS
jgi:FkbM family methyltransferase